MPGGGKPKLQTPELKQQALALVARLNNRGHTHWQIRNALCDEMGVKVSVGMIGTYLKEIRQKYVEEQKAEHAEYVAEKIEQYRAVREQAWAAWDKSWKDSETITREEMVAKPTKEELAQEAANTKLAKSARKKVKGDPVESLRLLKQIVKCEGRIPANEFLSTIVSTLDAECRLRGLNLEKPAAPTINIFTKLEEMFMASETVDPMSEIFKQKGLTVPAIEPTALPSENGTGLQNGDGHD